jgi:hypothetical protein
MRVTGRGSGRTTIHIYIRSGTVGTKTERGRERPRSFVWLTRGSAARRGERGAGPKGVQALPQLALELIGSHGSGGYADIEPHTASPRVLGRAIAVHSDDMWTHPALASSMSSILAPGSSPLT